MIETNAQAEKTIQEFLRLPVEKQAAVAEFVRRLSEIEKKTEKLSFLSAVDEFMDEHPELLKRLAQ